MTIAICGVWAGCIQQQCTPIRLQVARDETAESLIPRVAGNRIWKFFITYIPYIYPVYTPYTVETVHTKNPSPPHQTPRGVIA